MPQLDFTTYSSGLKWIVLAVSVGYLLLRFVLAAPTWTMTRLQTNDRTNLWNGALLLALLSIPVGLFDVLSHQGLVAFFKFSGLGLVAFISYLVLRIMRRLWQRVIYYWNLTEGFRLRALGKLMLGLWCEWLAPRRARAYFVLTVFFRVRYPLILPLPVLETGLFLLQATFGQYLVFINDTPALDTIRRIWIVGFPLFFLAAWFRKVGFGFCALPTGTVTEVWGHTIYLT